MSGRRSAKPHGLRHTSPKPLRGSYTRPAGKHVVPWPTLADGTQWACRALRVRHVNAEHGDPGELTAVTFGPGGWSGRVMFPGYVVDIPLNHLEAHRG